MAKALRTIGKVAGVVATVAAFAGNPLAAAVATPPSAGFRAGLRK